MPDSLANNRAQPRFKRGTPGHAVEMEAASGSSEHYTPSPWSSRRELLQTSDSLARLHALPLSKRSPPKACLVLHKFAALKFTPGVA